jgi:membrane associated rhomboid family serine protease
LRFASALPARLRQRSPKPGTKTPMPLKKYSVVSILLILFSVAMAGISNMGELPDALQPWMIASPGSTGLDDIASGQIWRLVTPIFIHFGPLHLLFNMMWIWDLGKLMETKKGIGFYLGFVLVVGVASNLAQYLFTGAPNFGGMSGVVYGMFGYLWTLGRSDPSAGFMLNKNVVVMMLAWLVLCWTGLLGPIANGAHTAGLLIGAAWGYRLKRAH